MSIETKPAPTAVPTLPKKGLGERVRAAVAAQAMQIVLVWLGIVILFSVLSPTAFFDGSNFRNIAISVSILAVLGVGTTFIIITAGIDLSMGTILVFSGVVSSMVMERMGDGQGWGVAIAGIAAALLSGVGWGLLNGFCVAKLKVPPMIVTLGTFVAALGLAQVLTGGIDLRAAPDVLVDTVGFGRILGVPILVLIAAAVVILGIVLLHRTKFGLHTSAIGSNPEACRRVGINVDRQLIKVYAFAGLLAGLAGVLNLAFFRSTTIAGHSLTNLDVIAGVVIGGTSLFGGIGAVFGTVIGLLIPATLRNGFVILGVQPYWQQVVVGAFLIAAVYADQVRRAAANRGKATTNLFTRMFSSNRKDV
ncbi:ABC transporter permease [Pseudactinotalea sp. HY160]|uniref:ABC transporter permease n=1 Tax=Pseudactinotalea sp. HY160 TaxID=2654490 RepID=UPI00128D88C5|nr:ABC transporter permease [Pseudactinotalea sp. HY160]MPV49674.1 ABC transporter permease [Pseudactinotalea sp. HY160]